MFLLSSSHSIWGAGFPPRISLQVIFEQFVSLLAVEQSNIPTRLIDLPEDVFGLVFLQN